MNFVLWVSKEIFISAKERCYVFRFVCLSVLTVCLLDYSKSYECV